MEENRGTVRISTLDSTRIAFGLPSFKAVFCYLPHPQEVIAQLANFSSDISRGTEDEMKHDTAHEKQEDTGIVLAIRRGLLFRRT